MKRLAAVLGLLWCAVNLVVAYWMLTGGILAKTAQHEGIVAQASLLLGGLLVAVFSVLLGRQCLRMFAAPNEATGS